MEYILILAIALIVVGGIVALFSFVFGSIEIFWMLLVSGILIFIGGYLQSRGTYTVWEDETNRFMKFLGIKGRNVDKFTGLGSFGSSINYLGYFILWGVIFTFIFGSIATFMSRIKISQAAPTPNSNLVLSDTEKNLIYQTQFWTYVDVQTVTRYTVLGIENIDTYYYLTYLSPQLIEAAINQMGYESGMTDDEKYLLFDKIKEKLRFGNNLPMLLSIKSNDPRVDIQIVNETSKIFVRSINGDTFGLDKYSGSFDYPISLETMQSGYLFFPIEKPNAIEGINLNNDPSFFVRMENIIIKKGRFYSDRQTLSWDVKLVPITLPLEKMKAISFPVQDDKNIYLKSDDVTLILQIIFKLITTFAS